jgi:hypothetical protein
MVQTMTTNEYIRGVKELGGRHFRGIAAAIITNTSSGDERALRAIRQYIADNPLKWALDMDNPANFPKRPPPETADDYLRDAGVT